MPPSKTRSFSWIILPSSILLLFLYTTTLLHPTTTTTTTTCNLFTGRWGFDPTRKPMYDHTCPFHRNSWNCIKNQRQNMGRINSWKWVPEKCGLSRVDPERFLGLMRNRNVGFVGDSLNENLLVSFLCILRLGDEGAKKWKKKGAWRGGYFSKYNVTVGYHRAVLLAKYKWQPKQPDSNESGLKGTYRVDVDIPADD
ncbi:hypothetical protein Leryth_004745 [Lithospermum erythrorhizon]|nr:hypothetical protein Leryth_004745 [Lithospermum erythrorhizon]